MDRSHVVQQCHFHGQVMLRAPEELVPEVGISALSAGASLPRDAEAGGWEPYRSCWDNSDLDVLFFFLDCEMFKVMMCWIVIQQWLLYQFPKKG